MITSSLTLTREARADARSMAREKDAAARDRAKGGGESEAPRKPKEAQLPKTTDGEAGGGVRGPSSSDGAANSAGAAKEEEEVVAVPPPLRVEGEKTTTEGEGAVVVELT